MARRQMQYESETYCLGSSHDGEIVRLGSRDKYTFESYTGVDVSGYPILYIFRFVDGRTIDEYKYYELKLSYLGNCNCSEEITMQSDDIILGISQIDGCNNPVLYLLRPYYARGASQTLTSEDVCDQYEDFTTYTKVDPNSNITVTTNQIEHDAYRNEDAYVYYDKGSGFFGDFEHLLHAQVVSGEGGSRGAWWALANEVDDLYALQYSATTKVLYVICIYDGWETYVTLGYANNGVINHDTYHTGIDGNVSYYLTVKRSGTTFTCEIRTGSHSGVLVDTLTVTSVTTDTFRYIYGSNTVNDSNSEMIGMQINDLDLHGS